MAEGRKFAAEKRWADAEITFRKLIQKNSADGLPHLELAKVLYAKGKGVEALQEFSEAVRLAPDNAEARKLYTEFLLAAYLQDPERPENRRQALIRLAEADLQKDAASFSGWRLKGILARAAGNREDAIAAFRRALAARSNDPELTPLLAETLALSPEGQAEAITVLTNWVSKQPKEWKAYQALAGLHGKKRDFAQAIAVYESARREMPNLAAPLLELAILYREQSQAERARQLLDELAANPARYPNGLLEAGDFLYAKRDFEGALRFYRAGWASQDKSRAEYGKRLLRVLGEQGKLDEVRPLVAEILKSNPDDLEAATADALLQMDRGHPAAAAERLEILINKHPDNSTLHFHRGRALLRKGDPDKAGASWREAMRLAPAASEPRLALARLQLEQGKASETLELTTLALRLQPDNPEAMHLRIASLQSLNRWDEARAAIRDFRQQYPQVTGIEVDEAISLLREGKTAAAEALFRKHYRLGAWDMRLIGAYAKAMVASGKKAEALQMLEAENQKSPNQASLQYVLAETYLVNGRRNDAIAAFSALQKARPSFLLPGLRLASLYLQERKLPEALALLQQMNTAMPGLPEVLTLLGQTHEAAQDWNAAKAAYRQALERNPENLLAANGLANLIAQHGSDAELPDALRLAMRAKAMAPRDALVLDTLGLVYLRQNEKGLAVQELQAALRLQPGNVKIREHLARASRN